MTSCCGTWQPRLLRRPVRRFSGAQSAYLPWLLVPITACAALLPAVHAKTHSAVFKQARERSCHRPRAVVVMSVSGSALAQQSAAATADPLAQLISISLQDSDLETVLKTIAKTANITLVIDPALDTKQKMNMRLDRVEVRGCLALITKSPGATLREANGAVYIGTAH